jgi:N-acetyl-gamma-glutamyl-phosphate reductase
LAIRVGIIGATGYTGQELVRLLLDHPQVQITALASQSYAGKPYSHVYPSFSKLIDLTCVQEDSINVAESVDVLFFALPHSKAAEKVTEQLLEKVRVIDLGSDFRLKNPAAYEKWYGFKHPCPELLKKSVYGIPELKRKELASARLVANPGCYATASILALRPLIEKGVVDPKSVVIDGKSGVSGAGRSLTLGVHFDEVDESVKAYKVTSHRHTPEIEQELHSPGSEIALTFTPHLIPMNRGILITAYASLSKKMDEAALKQIYLEAYGKEEFIRLFDKQGDEYDLPETRWVKGTNFCDIGLKLDTRTDRVVVVSALDNLIKGASGQAVQCMNILFGLPETTGLTRAALFPA